MTREEAIKIIKECKEKGFKHTFYTLNQYHEALEMAIKALEQKPKMGKWIYGEDNPGTGRDGWYCNQCGHFEFWDYSLDMKSAKLNLPNICPNCESKMQEVEE